MTNLANQLDDLERRVDDVFALIDNCPTYKALTEELEVVHLSLEQRNKHVEVLEEKVEQFVALVAKLIGGEDEPIELEAIQNSLPTNIIRGDIESRVLALEAEASQAGDSAESLKALTIAHDSLVGSVNDMKEDVVEMTKTLQGEVQVLQGQVSLLMKVASNTNGGAFEMGKAKIPEPKSFGGARDAREVDNFIFDMELYFTATKNDSDAGKLKMVPMYLANDAKLWWRTKSYSAGSIREYVRSFTALMLDIKDMSEADRLFNFQKGLKPWARNELVRRGVKELSTTLAVAKVSMIIQAMPQRESLTPRQGGSTLALLKQGYYWPQLEDDVREYTKTCLVCQQDKADRQKPARLLQPYQFQLDHGRVSPLISLQDYRSGGDGAISGTNGREVGRDSGNSQRQEGQENVLSAIGQEISGGEVQGKIRRRRGPRSRSSQYRGVTFYRRTGRWESHIWDAGKQVYLGGFDTAHAAARTYDRAAIKFRGVEADINFNLSDYEEELKQMKNLTKEEFVHILRRQSTGFSRGILSGLFDSEVEAARAYDRAVICNGRDAVTNFDLLHMKVAELILDLKFSHPLGNGHRGNEEHLQSHSGSYNVQNGGSMDMLQNREFEKKGMVITQSKYPFGLASLPLVSCVPSSVENPNMKFMGKILYPCSMHQACLADR
ncbi:hypothetical protein GH714_020613 [Hevea brasiliensis]|uniref:AP2/ERF domain-containing protein n=1 Tax=Hevea brasiliensis TaxID=3981 RepID=A0A6A6N6X4_HEVBR|nr:hypothetical protein GH714_020613 [Hevea brasiliensis]